MCWVKGKWGDLLELPASYCEGQKDKLAAASGGGNRAAECVSIYHFWNYGDLSWNYTSSPCQNGCLVYPALGNRQGLSG